MSIKSIYGYTVIREYNNLYGLEEVIKRIIHYHINDISMESLSKKNIKEEVINYEKQQNN